MEKIDILLPTYNGEKYIGQQLESLLRQSYKDIRIIIRDDNSSDKTKEIVEEYLAKDSRITLINDEDKNLGLVKNIERLLEYSDANYIMYCDQDDVWFQTKVEKMYNQISKEQNIPILLHSDCYVTDENLNIKKVFKGKDPLNSGLVNSFFNYYVQGASCIFNKKLKKKLLPFPDKVYIHDRYTHLISELEGRRVYLKEPLMYYRQHGNNLIGSRNLWTKLRNNINIFSKSLFLIEDKNLITELYKKEKYKKNLEIYINILNNKYSFLEKIKLIRENKIKLNFKSFILFFLK